MDVERDRVIARPKPARILVGVPQYEPDPDAPSVAEVVEALRQAQVELFPGKTASKLGTLIARLEGE